MTSNLLLRVESGRGGAPYCCGSDNVDEDDDDDDGIISCLVEWSLSVALSQSLMLLFLLLFLSMFAWLNTAELVDPPATDGVDAEVARGTGYFCRCC